MREVWHSSNTVPTKGPRLGFPYYDPSTPGAFTAEGIPLSATWGRAWLLCGSIRLPRVNTSRIHELNRVSGGKVYNVKGKFLRGFILGYFERMEKSRIYNDV